MSWDSLTQRKSDGGLGFREIQDFNTKMLAKNAWQILTSPDCLLARLLLRKYCYNSSFLTSSCPASASHGWRGVVEGLNLLKLQLGKAIGDGKTTKVWYDSWISRTSHIIVYGPPPEATRDLHVSDLLLRGTGDWNRHMVEAVLPDLAETIYSIKPSIFQVEDSYCWQKTKSGIYSVKSGYYALREEHGTQDQLHLPAANFDWQKFVWRELTAPKLKLFLWRMCRGALPLGANLRSRGIATPGLCPHCNEDETVLHLFFLCPFAIQVWERAPFVINPDFSDTETLHEAFQLISTCLTSWLLWGIWTARNLLVFKNRQVPALTVVTKACSSGREWIQA